MFRTGFRPDRPSVVRLSALGVAAVLVLGGCSGSDGDPGAEAAEGGSSNAPPGSTGIGGDETEPAMSFPAPTPARTPTAAYRPATAEGSAENVPLPVIPELAKQETKEGLEAFAEYWYSLVNYGYETGDPEPLRTITGPDCSVCENYYSSLRSGFDDQDWMAGSSVQVRDVHSDFILTPDGNFQVLIQITQDDLEYYGPGGIDYGPTIGIVAPITQLIEASYQNGVWRAARVENI